MPPARVCISLLACAFAVAATSAVAADPTVPLRVPSAASIPSGPLGVDVRRGEALFNTTQATAKAYVGNGLQFTSCHLQDGTVAYAAPLVGLWGVFPEFVARSDRVESVIQSTT
jgi:thiosulfate dehydrogenase